MVCDEIFGLGYEKGYDEGYEDGFTDACRKSSIEEKSCQSDDDCKSLISSTDFLVLVFNSSAYKKRK
jgi:flagellar biosynthesis/type III secretory pathway protein FliH